MATGAAIGSVFTSYALLLLLANHGCPAGKFGGLCADGIRGFGIGAAVGAGVGAGMIGVGPRCSYTRALGRGLLGGAIGAAPGYLILRDDNPLGVILSLAGATLGATLAVHPACGG